MNSKGILAAAAISVLMLTGCSMAYGDNSTVTPTVSQDVPDSEAVLHGLQFAEEITLQKKVISWNDVYTVSADGEEIGEIRGQYIYALGDTFSLFTNNDNLVGSEGEGFRIINHVAEVYDYNNQPIGSIKENLHIFLTNYDIYNVDGESIGKAQQNLSLAMNFTINNRNGVEEYRIEKALISWGANITITRLTPEPNVHAIYAVWLAAIANEVDESNNSDDDRSSDDSENR